MRLFWISLALFLGLVSFFGEEAGALEFSSCHSYILDKDYELGTHADLLKFAIQTLEDGKHEASSTSGLNMDASRTEFGKRKLQNQLWIPTFEQDESGVRRAKLKIAFRKSLESPKITIKDVVEFDRAKIRAIKNSDEHTAVLVENRNTSDQFSHYSVAYISNNLTERRQIKIFNFPEGKSDYQDFILSSDGNWAGIVIENQPGSQKYSIFVHSLKSNNADAQMIQLGESYKPRSDAVFLENGKLLYSNDIGKKIYSVNLEKTTDRKAKLIWENTETVFADNFQDPDKHYVKFHPSSGGISPHADRVKVEIEHLESTPGSKEHLWYSNVLIFNRTLSYIEESHPFIYSAKFGEIPNIHDVASIPPRVGLIYPTEWGYSKVLKSSGKSRLMIGTFNKELVWIDLSQPDPIYQASNIVGLVSIEPVTSTSKLNGYNTVVKGKKLEGVSPRIFPVGQVVHLQDLKAKGIDPKDLKLMGVSDLGQGYLLLRSELNGEKYQSMVKVPDRSF